MKMTFIMDVSGHEVGVVGFTEEKAKMMGLSVASVYLKALKTRPAYGGKRIHCKLIADRGNRNLLGGQIVSQDEIGGIINELALTFAERVPLSHSCGSIRPILPL